MFRFIKYCRKQRNITMNLKAAELDFVEEALVKYSQGISFLQEISDLSKKSVEKSRLLYSLMSFIDENRILRVRGE